MHRKDVQAGDIVQYVSNSDYRTALVLMVDSETYGRPEVIDTFDLFSGNLYTHYIDYPSITEKINHIDLLQILQKATLARIDRRKKNPERETGDMWMACKCLKCGEYYEPENNLEHICLRQNSVFIETE